MKVAIVITLLAAAVVAEAQQATQQQPQAAQADQQKPLSAQAPVAKPPAAQIPAVQAARPSSATVLVPSQPVLQQNQRLAQQPGLVQIVQPLAQQPQVLQSQFVQPQAILPAPAQVVLQPVQPAPVPAAAPAKQATGRAAPFAPVCDVNKSIEAQCDKAADKRKCQVCVKSKLDCPAKQGREAQAGGAAVLNRPQAAEAVPACSAADTCASQVACLESKLKSNAKVFEACNA